MTYTIANTAPVSPKIGDSFFSITESTMKVFDGADWFSMTSVSTSKEMLWSMCLAIEYIEEYNSNNLFSN